LKVKGLAAIIAREAPSADTSDLKAEAMQPDDYPSQEPFSEPARKYHDEVMRRGAQMRGEEVRYGADPYQSLCIYRASALGAPVLAFLHGGGWTNGYKEWMAFMAPALTAAGVTFATIGYRLAPAQTFPIGFEDACAGVKALAEKTSPASGGSARLFVGGHSAGGHYAALMALTRADLNVRGCLPISGVYDFGPQSGLSTRPRFLGPADSGLEHAASPIEHVGAKPCAFLIAHGSDDFPHLMRQAERFEEKLATAGGDVARIVLDGRNHFTASYAGGEHDGPWVPKAIAWIARH
jgi:arylformamidase